MVVVVGVVVVGAVCVGVVEALRSLRISLEDARAALKAQRRRTNSKQKKTLPAEELPISAAGQAAFEQALREAVRLGSGHLASEHLLLALLRENGHAVKTLVRLGIAPRTVEERLQEELDRRRATERLRSARNARRNVRARA